MYPHFPGYYFQFLHGFKGDFLNYSLKCNRLKSTERSTRKKNWHTKQNMKNFVYKWLRKTFGSYRLSKLSAQECNLRNQGKVWWSALTRKGDCWTRRPTPPRQPPSLCSQKRKLSGTSTSNMTIMQGQNLRNLYSLIFGKYSESQERLSIAMYIIGNGTDFAQTQSPPLFRVAEPRNRLCR